ncbi:50S ribosomal protein L10 [Candidatus Woesearchaeota archaeon]|jgi:large subunit ribosomal protein L10|nr:50S ribosomal protein L10 [Candidatus Woesearchaeota archaeon]MBT6518266.1 50S ribosomal protein L10 [Candidatus Woesearchaeota archaeon]MBT7367563.1 50S ribosomal protein L10 [Candidatus Woesearchaeota archaeon]
MAHVSEAKKQTVDEFVKLIKEYPIIGALNMQDLPSKQIQNMRENLRSTVLIKMTKRRLMKVAFEKADKSKPGVKKLFEYLRGMPALLFTKENPFTIFKTLKKNKSNAPAKAGQIAPKEIIIPAGPTSFAPGPIIGELGALGIQAGVDAGKVTVKADASVAQEGDVIKPELAAVLTRLGIEPMEIGLDLIAIYEDGDIFTKSVLDIDEQEYIDNITKGHSWAFNLAMDAGVHTPETLGFMITKAFSDARSLAVEQNVHTKDTVNFALNKAENQAASLKAQINV